jgi:hypothetical protein
MQTGSEGVWTSLLEGSSSRLALVVQDKAQDFFSAMVLALHIKFGARWCPF